MYHYRLYKQLFPSTPCQGQKENQNLAMSGQENGLTKSEKTSKIQVWNDLQ